MTTASTTTSNLPMSNLEHHGEPAGELLSGVLGDARDLAVAEVDKLKAELLTAAKELGTDIKFACIGFLILTVATILLGAAIALVLVALGLPAWLSFAIVGVACALVGYLFLKRYVLDKAEDAASAARTAVEAA